ncbi:MAG: GNAT family N-acetyltransferase [Armatimonadetes bacterium]|nr:GNAT family N-acetyltransferase [Armatimonadota bacterium]
MKSSSAVLACSDIVATLAFYQDVLGFETVWAWGEPPTFGSASSGGATILFNRQPELAAKIQGHQHWINVDDADELHETHRARGAKIVEELGDRPWGFREYVVEDLNGYHLRFAGPPLGTSRPSQPFPEGVRIERRVPRDDEYRSVVGAAFGNKSFLPDQSSTTWGGIVALSPDGEAIGTVRIMQDALGWFSVWDVGVLPRWQGHRIGSKMMQEALDLIHESSPGANVFLFTYQNGFYEKLGFSRETSHMKRVCRATSSSSVVVL